MGTKTPKSTGKAVAKSPTLAAGANSTTTRTAGLTVRSANKTPRVANKSAKPTLKTPSLIDYIFTPVTGVPNLTATNEKEIQIYNLHFARAEVLVAGLGLLVLCVSVAFSIFGTQRFELTHPEKKAPAEMIPYQDSELNATNPLIPRLLKIDAYNSSTEDNIGLMILEGEECYKKGDVDGAWDIYYSALDVAIDEDDLIYEAFCFDGIGVLNYQLGNYNEAIKKFDKSQAIFGEQGYREYQSEVLTKIGLTYDRMGNPEKANEYYRKALGIDVDSRGDWNHDEASLLCYNALIFKDLGEYEESLNCLTRAIEIDRKTGNRYAESSSIRCIGLVYKDMGDYEKSLTYLTRAADIYREIGNRYGESSTMDYTGLVYKEMGDYEKSLTYLTRAVEINREIGNTRGEILSLKHIGVVYKEMGDDARALKYLREAIEVYKQYRLMEENQHNAELI